MRPRVSLLVLLLVLTSGTAFAAYIPPKGIPAPSFGIDEVAPDLASATRDGKCTNWPSATNTNCFQVDNSNLAFTCSDATNGRPGAPRCTIPTTYAAGDYLEVTCTLPALCTYTAPSAGTGWTMNGSSTSSYVFLRFLNNGSIATQVQAASSSEHYLRGSYWIIDGIVWNNTRIRRGNSTDATFTSIRNCEVKNWARGAGTTILSFGIPASAHHDNVTYLCQIHDNGDLATPVDIDVDNHGVGAGPSNSNYWLLDSQTYRNAGDGIQINAGSLANQASCHHIYVGRLTTHDNRQSGAWTKQCTDIIFSEVHSYNHWDLDGAGGGVGACLGGQYAPQRFWIIFSVMHDCDSGIKIASTSGLGNGTDFYAVGNLIYDITPSATSNNFGYPVDNSSTVAAISIWDIVNISIVANTIYTACAGIKHDTGGLTLIRIVNNIIGHHTYSTDREIWLPATIGNDAISEMKHNVVEGPSEAIAWNSDTNQTLAAFAAGHSPKGANSSNATPVFTNPSGKVFTLEPSDTVAKDMGFADHPVYGEFLAQYGISIAYDLNGVARSQGAGTDIGAYEYAASVVSGTRSKGRRMRIH